MKLVITIVQDNVANQVLGKLTTAGFGATKLASTGGFLKTGNTTLIIGVEDTKVSSVLELLHDSGATVFVLDVERFERI